MAPTRVAKTRISPTRTGPEDGTNADEAWLSASVAEHHSPNPCGGARMLQRFTTVQD